MMIMGSMQLPCPTKYKYKYKYKNVYLAVVLSDAGKVYDAQFWPCDIYIRRWHGGCPIVYNIRQLLLDLLKK